MEMVIFVSRSESHQVATCVVKLAVRELQLSIKLPPLEDRPSHQVNTEVGRYDDLPPFGSHEFSNLVFGTQSYIPKLVYLPYRYSSGALCHGSFGARAFALQMPILRD